MIEVMALGVISVFFAYLSKYHSRGLGLKLSFLCIFLFLALRYNYGNDYHSYLDGYFEITSGKIFLTGERWEPGWRFLHIIFLPFGFFVMIAVLALFNSFVLYKTIKKYVPSNYHWLAVFLYVFNPYMMLVHSSAMRQGLAISIFLIAIRFLARRRAIGYFVCILIAASFHKSALVLLPIFALSFVNIRINKALAIAILTSFISLFALLSVLGPYINQLINAIFPKYASAYYGGTSFSSGLGLIFMIGELIVVLYYAGLEFEPRLLLESSDEDECYDLESCEILRDQSVNVGEVKSRRILYLLAIISFMFVPLGLSLAMFSRINMYFTVMLIFVFPIIMSKSRNEAFKILFLLLIVLFTLFQFLTFFMSPLWREGFGTYQTIFSAPQFY